MTTADLPTVTTNQIVAAVADHLITLMPTESPIDLDQHARRIAEVIVNASNGRKAA